MKPRAWKLRRIGETNPEVRELYDDASIIA